MFVCSVDDWECQQDKWTVTELALKHLQEAASEKFPGGKYKSMLFHFFSPHFSHTLSTYFIINGIQFAKMEVLPPRPWHIILIKLVLVDYIINHLLLKRVVKILKDTTKINGLYNKIITYFNKI